MSTLLLTGFEPFLDVSLNPSGEVARRLDGASLGPGVSVVGQVLPVSFGRAPAMLEAALGAFEADALAVVSLGVHRGAAFRLEERARAVFESEQPDNDGARGGSIRLPGPPERRPRVDLDACEGWLRRAGAAEVVRSDDAGGYLCERIFRAGLDLAEPLGVPALFLHVPPVERTGVDDQTRVVRGFLESLAGSLEPPAP